MHSSISAARTIHSGESTNTQAHEITPATFMTMNATVRMDDIPAETASSTYRTTAMAPENIPNIVFMLPPFYLVTAIVILSFYQ